MGDPTLGKIYRSYAAQEQAYANEARSPAVRTLHERAAAKWLERAAVAEGKLP